MKNGLLIFVKNQEEGKVKTRLAATIGNKAALDVYRKLLALTARNTGDLATDKFVFYSGYVEPDDIWSNLLYKKQIQHGNDLGQRMFNAFIYGFDLGYDKLALIGSDCPDLDSDLIDLAFSKLDDVDIVIGPASDGGYYLLASKCFYKAIFQNINWSTNEVLCQTLQACQGLGLSTFLLPVLSDIDVEEDLINHPDF